MRIIEAGPDQAREVSHHGSRALRVQPLVRTDGVGVTLLRVAGGGEVGEHPATVDQLLLVVAGRGAVSGGDGVWHDIAAGQAAVWAAGERHTTRAYEDLVAVAVELPGLADAPQRQPQSGRRTDDLR